MARPTSKPRVHPPAWTRDRVPSEYDLLADPTERDPLITARGRSHRDVYLATLRRPTVVAYFVATAGLVFVEPSAVVVTWTIALVAIQIRTDMKTEGDWWPPMLEALGLAPLVHQEMPPMTPLLRVVGTSDFLLGKLLGGGDERRELLMYHSIAPGKGRGAAAQTAHKTFTAVLYRAPVPIGFRFLAADPARSQTDRMVNTSLAHLATIPGSNVSRFSVESVALHERFDLRCSDGDAASARRCFSPTFMVWFAEHGLPFECEHGYLAVYVPHHLAHRSQFLDLLDRADRIYAELGGTV